jgi:signal transduction histidine kinase
VKIKVTNLKRNEKNSIMIQFINCTEEVSYDKEKAHSDLLMMINATVSHELRNPLNSLLAQNI